MSGSFEADTCVTMNDTPNLALPYILPSQAQKHVTHNEAIRALDCLVQLAVKSRTLAAPPESPEEGARYLVAAAATGDWAGQSEKIAAFQDGAWAFYEPKEGWIAWVSDEHELAIYSAGTWASFSGGSGGGDGGTGGSGDITVLDNLVHLGINGSADATNRLALKSSASLFDNVGNGHQQKINKYAAGDTASVLYQTNYSGRAEMGLAGDDDFHFKVSPDGATWYEALKIDRNTGKLSFPMIGGPREILTANRTYYVRTDGSDANTGLANTSGGAFATIKKAYEVICATLDLAGFTVTIKLGNSGTFTTPWNLNKIWSGGGAVVLQGDTTTPGNTILRATGADAIFSSVVLPGLVTLDSLEVGTTTSGSALNVTAPGTIQFQNVRWASCAAVHLTASGGGAFINGIGNYSIVGGAAFYHAFAVHGGFIQTNNKMITLSGAPAFATFAVASDRGGIEMVGGTFSGSATGSRYNASTNGVISSGGGGASYFPGSSAGSTATGGQYA